MFADYAKSEKEFNARFGIMMMFRYCMDEAYINQVIDVIKSINNHTYYVDMAISWFLCECVIKFPDTGLNLIKQKLFTRFIQNKAISKCHDSFRISDELKKELKTYKIA